MIASNVLIAVVLSATIVLPLVFVEYLFNHTRIGKNHVGRRLGYGCCPNCGDSWWRNTSGSIVFKSDRDFWGDYQRIGLPQSFGGKIGYGVLICSRCLDNPATLDAARIQKDILGYGWNIDDVKLVGEAVERYREGALAKQV